MNRNECFKPINLVVGCSGTALALAVAAWVTGKALDMPVLHAVGTALFFAGVIIAFLPLLGVLVALCIGRLRD